MLTALLSLLPFQIPPWVRSLLASPVLWACLAGLYCIHWGDARGYARHKAEVEAATAQTNVRVGAANGAAGAAVTEQDKARDEALTEANGEIERLKQELRVAKEATQPGPASPAARGPDRVADQCPPPIPEQTLTKLNRIK